MVRFLYGYVEQVNLAEIYCSTTHKESLVHSEYRSTARFTEL